MAPALILTAFKDMMHHKPLIVTLETTDPVRQYFTALRTVHFPAHANYLDAHITLFYRLPSAEPAVAEILQRYARRTPMMLEVNDIVNFGKGVAFTLACPELESWRAAMQEELMPWLRRQDKQPFRPHITIQNKVTAFKAQQLYDALLPDFRPFCIPATGMHTWLYLGGPWKSFQQLPFII